MNEAMKQIQKAIGLTSKRLWPKGALKKQDRDALADYCVNLISLDMPENDPLMFSISDLSMRDRAYWAGYLYASTVANSYRKNMAMYFTPPPLAEYVLDRAKKFGVDFAKGTFIDLAAGGAAFVEPIFDRMLIEGCPRKEIDNRICGVEIDPALAAIAKECINHRAETKLDKVIISGDGLRHNKLDAYDAVIGNPPYRVMSKKERKALPDWASPCVDYANLYSVFTIQAIRLAKPGGVVSLLIPTSFITGEYFKKFRKWMRANADVLAIDLIEGRQCAFLDVAQDICLLSLRKKAPKQKPPSKIELRSVTAEGEWKSIGQVDLPTDLGDSWNLRTTFVKYTAFSLSDYGYSVRCGSIVHNRDSGLVESALRPKKSLVPLVWGHAIKINEPVIPVPSKASTDHKKATFVSIKGREASLLSESAVVLQRTTSGDQSRRLRAATVDDNWIQKYGGFYAENHVVVVTPENGKEHLSSEWMCKVLNTKAVDLRMRPLLTSNSVNISALRKLPLPDPEKLKATLTKHSWKISSIEEAVEEAYST
ncbi:MAG: Eco57I restriction-modification methylase domain-containing protein [Magnetovibrio sp.]|nr:Eco57I restriction-modification methylase domain-containing protein [Magnetovibrio sp.]